MPVDRHPDRVTYTGHDRPLVACLVHGERGLGVWHVGDLREWRHTDTGWEAVVTYTTGASETRWGVFTADNVMLVE